MGVRLEQLMAMADRIQGLENILRAFAMERLFETAMRLGKQKEALEVVKLFEKIYFDEGGQDIDELREALEKLDLQGHPELARVSKSFMKMYLDYVIPPRPR